MPAGSAHTFRSWDDYLDKHRLEPTHHFAERTIRIHVWTAQEKFNADVESTGMNEAEPAEAAALTVLRKKSRGDLGGGSPRVNDQRPGSPSSCAADRRGPFSTNVMTPSGDMCSAPSWR